MSSSSTLAIELEGAMGNERICFEQVAHARAAIERAACGCSSVILVDEDPPDMTAADLLRGLANREGGSDALVMLMSSRTSEIDRVIAFELGVDDFVPKPIGARELSLRLRALLRRHHAERMRVKQFRAGPFMIDTVNETVTCNGAPVRLTSVEFRLFEHLARHSGQVQDRRELLARVWKWCEPVDQRHAVSRTVDTHVKRLREKLGSASQFIETIRGVGYRMRLAS